MIEQRKNEGDQEVHERREEQGRALDVLERMRKEKKRMYQ